MTDQNCGSILVGEKRKCACTCRCAHAQSIRKWRGHLPHTYSRSLIPGEPTAIVFYETEEFAYRSESSEPRPTMEQSFAMVHVEHPRKKETQAPQTKCAAFAPAATHPNGGRSCCLTRVPPHHPCSALVVPGCCRMAAWSLQPQQWSDVGHWALVPHLGKQRYPDCSEGAPAGTASAESGTSGRPG